MTQEQRDRTLRGIAGTFTIIAAIMSIIDSHYWSYFIIFIGANLLQSAFTKWCPMITFLKIIFPEERIGK